MLPNCRSYCGSDCSRRQTTRQLTESALSLRFYRSLGRPRISAAVEKRIQDRLRTGMGIIKVAREVGVPLGWHH